MEIYGLQVSDGQQWLLAIAGALASHWVAFKLGRAQTEISERFTYKLNAAKDFRNAMNEAMADIPMAHEPWGGQLEQLRSFRRVVKIASKNYLAALPWKKQFEFEHHAIRLDGYAHRLLKHYEHPIEKTYGSLRVQDDVQALQKDLLQEARALLRIAGQFA